MNRTVVITGAAGSIGRKLATHMAGLGWSLRRLDVAPAAGVQTADLLDAGALGPRRLPALTR